MKQLTAIILVFLFVCTFLHAENSDATKYLCDSVVQLRDLPRGLLYRPQVLTGITWWQGVADAKLDIGIRIKWAYLGDFGLGSGVTWDNWQPLTVSYRIPHTRCDLVFGPAKRDVASWKSAKSWNMWLWIATDIIK